MLFSTGGMRNVSALEREVGSSMGHFLFVFLLWLIQNILKLVDLIEKSNVCSPPKFEDILPSSKAA